MNEARRYQELECEVERLNVENDFLRSRALELVTKVDRLRGEKEKLKLMYESVRRLSIERLAVIEDLRQRSGQTYTVQDMLELYGET